MSDRSRSGTSLPLIAALAALPLLALAPRAGLAGTLRAGVARVSITPAADEFPYQVAHEHDFVGVHDDVYARGLVLDDGRHRTALISLEVTTVPIPGEIAKAVADALKLPAGAIMITATHTHNVPLVFWHGHDLQPTQMREMQRLKQAAVQVATEAAAHLQPARIGYAQGRAYVNVNNGEEANRKSWYDPDASSDKTLAVLRVQDAAGKPLALVLNYATHGEVMFRSVTKDGGYEVTGDLPGAVSRLLEAQPGGAPAVLFTSGAEADQLPMFKSLQPKADLPAADEGAGGWALLDVQARRLAAAALDIQAGAKPGTAVADIRTDQTAVSCPGQHYDVDHATGQVLSVKDTGPVSIPLTTIRINDIALAGVAADLASDIGVAIKAASPIRQTMVVTMLAGSIGYILNDGTFIHPGHGAFGSPIKPGCAAPSLSKAIAGMLGGNG